MHGNWNVYCILSSLVKKRYLAFHRLLDCDEIVARMYLQMNKDKKKRWKMFGEVCGYLRVVSGPTILHLISARVFSFRVLAFISYTHFTTVWEEPKTFYLVIKDRCTVFSCHKGVYILFKLRGYLPVWCCAKAEQSNKGFIHFLCVKREESWILGVKDVN